MIAEHMRHTILSMRRVLKRGNEDFAELAPFFLDSLEADLERMAAVQDAAAMENECRSLKEHFSNASTLEP